MARLGRAAVTPRLLDARGNYGSSCLPPFSTTQQRKPRPPKIAPSMSAEELTRIMEKLVVATDMAGHQMLEYSRFEFEQVAQGRTSVEKMADLCLAEFLQRLNDGTSRVLRDLKATEEEVAEALKYFGPRDPDIRALEAKVLSFKPKIAFTAEEAALVRGRAERNKGAEGKNQGVSMGRIVCTPGRWEEKRGGGRRTWAPRIQWWNR